MVNLRDIAVISANISPKIVIPRDIAGNVEEEEDVLCAGIR